MTPHTRVATRADISALIALYDHLHAGDEKPTDRRAVEVFEQLRSFHGSAIFVGEVDNRLIAACTLIVIPNLTRGGRPFGLIENVVTHADFRRRGLGKLVLDAASDTAWKCDCYKVMLMTGSKDPKTLSFYESVGFAQTKTGFQKSRDAT